MTVPDRWDAITDDAIRRAIPEFAALYADRPLKRNLGGMRFNHSFATWFVLKTLKPGLVIESGVWQGHSTWLIEQACPEAALYCLDVDFSRLIYRSAKATYWTKDFADCAWEGVDPTQALCLFDDHQNAYQRLKDMRWAGFRRALFDDNYPVSEGDFYSLRQMRAGAGHPNLQMTAKYLGSEEERKRRALFEEVIQVAGPRQQLLVPPNETDRALFARNAGVYYEFPPIVRLDRAPIFATTYEGAYATKPPLYACDALPPELAALWAQDETEFDYNWIAYVEI
ncbi:MAG: hypothetical protein IT565_05970 [Rhodospirillales bacterium]|nr:hypothetical protein [Rhodospirillales bacterium]